MAFFTKKPKQLKFKDFLKLPDDQKKWLLKAAGLSQEEASEENLNNISVFYLKGDYTQKTFLMDSSFVIIDGSIKSDHVDTFEIVLLVTQDIITNTLTTGNESIDVWGSVNVKSKLILGDVKTTFTIKKNLTVDTIINSVPSEKDLQLSVGGNIHGVKKIYIAENSYGQMGDKEALQKLGFKTIETMDPKEWEEITSQLY